VLFDKDGRLTRLRERALSVRPRPVGPEQHQFMQFMLYHSDDKARRHVESDPASALLVMHTSLADGLKMHYRLNGRWWLSNKRLLADLRGWDPSMAALVEPFLLTADPPEKYRLWSAILDRVAAPMGGRQPISENNCACPRCTRDLDRIARASVES
jgi:hypothetical protein